MYSLRIKDLRIKNNVTQKELADYLNVSHQSISKWENHVASPDIAYLPKLADFFEVSVDALLGLVPLSDHYSYRDDITEMYWNEKLNELLAINEQSMNEDYLRFLVRDVFKITKRIDLADFGCGYGYLGMMLLPLLPEGSTYTGYDISGSLIEEGKRRFKELGLSGNFIHCDLNSYKINQSFDLVICKSFLKHLNNHIKMLEKMIKVTRPAGLIVCVEENRLIRNDGLYIKDKYDPIVKSAFLQKNWEAEYANDGRDYLLGLRLPLDMERLGLTNINIRSNDCVQYISEFNKKYDKQVEMLKRTMLWNRPFTKDRIGEIYSYFLSRGMSRSEINNYIENEISYAQYIDDKRPNITRTLGLFITYGRKKHESNSRIESEILE